MRGKCRRFDIPVDPADPDPYSDNQYVVADGRELCTGENGCQLVGHNVIANQAPSTPTDFVKIYAEGRVPQGFNLNPFACLPDGSSPGAQSYPVNLIQLQMRGTKGNKSGLKCQFAVTGTTHIEFERSTTELFRSRIATKPISAT